MSSDSRRILIVDDEAAIGRMLSYAFRQAGYDVQVASSGPEAMTICESETFDVLLSDVKMPGMNGHELVRWLVKRCPETRRILMSGFDDTRCEGCGQTAVPCLLLLKPFAPKVATDLVDRMLNPTISDLVKL